MKRSSRSSNPFRSGSPVKDEQFGDRASETKFLVRAIERGQNVLVTSPRRYGKTSLLLRSADAARRKGARVAMTNLLYCSDRRELAEKITEAVITGGLGFTVRTEQQLRELASKLPGVKLSVERDGWKASIGLEHDEAGFLEQIKRPVELLADSARDNHPVSLIVDEFQQAAEIDADVPKVFKAITDDLPGVSLIFAGSRRHMMTSIFTGPGAPLLNVAERLELAVIPEKEMTAFLLERTASAGQIMEPEAAAMIYRAMRGIPHFVQLLAATAFDEESNKITPTVVTGALLEVLVRQRGELALRYEPLSLVQQRLIRALAANPVRDLYAVSFSKAIDRPTSSVQRAHAALEKNEHIVHDERMGWRVSDPIFELWLRHGFSIDLGEPVDPMLLMG